MVGKWLLDGNVFIHLQILSNRDTSSIDKIVGGGVREGSLFVPIHLSAAIKSKIRDVENIGQNSIYLA